MTGAAGFIGMHVARRLLADGHDVVGLDNLNAYYDPRLKKARIAELKAFANFKFQRIDIANRQSMAELFAAHRFPAVVHLAAQAGVRHSLIDPYTYADANLTGFLNVLEGCRHSGCRHLIYASSSSVYGANSRVPFRACDNVDHPLSLYGASKKANELMAHAYAHLFALPATGLRFFTVYGPWGRPDMAMWLFTEAIMQGRSIKLFNNGHTADRGNRRQAGGQGVAPDAAGGRSTDLCRCGGSRACRRIPAQDSDPGGGLPLHRLVPQLRCASNVVPCDSITWPHLSQLAT